MGIHSVQASEANAYERESTHFKPLKANAYE
jgi:hypothetical protein